MANQENQMPYSLIHGFDSPHVGADQDKSRTPEESGITQSTLMGKEENEVKPLSPQDEAAILQIIFYD